MTIKFYKYIFLLFCIQFAFGQNIRIDTTQLNYRLDLEQDYTIKSKKTFDFVNKKSDSKVKSEFLEIVTKRKKEFISDIKNGYK